MFSVCIDNSSDTAASDKNSETRRIAPNSLADMHMQDMDGKLPTVVICNNR